MKRMLVIFIAILVIMQFIRIDTTTKTTDNSMDFIALSGADANIAGMIRTACYDCHSHKTTYPWYSQVAPVSWWIGNHVNEGREHLNFSTWNQYDAEKQKHKLEECVEMIKEGEMPMKSFTWLHPEARLSDEQKQALSGFFNKMYEAL
jgi:hypothetical protein